jgi:hypothetical protein
MLAVMHEEMSPPMLRLLRQLRPDKHKVRWLHTSRYNMLLDGSMVSLIMAGESSLFVLMLDFFSNSIVRAEVGATKW